MSLLKSIFCNPDLYIGIASAVVGGYVAFLIARYQMNVARKENKESEKALREELEIKFKHDFDLQKNNLLLTHKLSLAQKFLSQTESLVIDAPNIFPMYLKTKNLRKEPKSIANTEKQHSNGTEIGRIIQKISTYKVDYAVLSKMLDGIKISVDLKKNRDDFDGSSDVVCKYLAKKTKMIENWNLKIPSDDEMQAEIQEVVDLIAAMDFAVREKYLSLLETLEEDTAK